MARSVMNHNFAEVPRANIPRSSFDRSCGHKLTFDADYLVPVYIDDIVPGDSASIQAEFFVRLNSPTVLPLMDNLRIETFWLFAPYRILWDNFPKFHGAQDDPDDSIDYTIPTYTSSSSFNQGTLFDYLGLVPSIANVFVGASALPARMYNKAFNDWFRDQNNQDSLTVDTGDGPDTPANYVIKKRGKRHDYFTSALPAPQRGDAVSASFTGDGVIATDAAAASHIAVYASSPAAYRQMDSDASVVDVSASAGTASQKLYLDSDHADSTLGININDLRLAIQTQRLLERDARSGTRYNEMVLAHYGVMVPDFRTQRVEFLGGGSTPMNITSVAQTTYQGTQTVEDAKGALAGVGTASGSHGFSKSFTEHGLLMCLMNVRGDITYSQGIERYWNKDTRYDFYYPVLAQIGEQAILNREIFYANNAGTGATQDDGVFGYIPRYDEMRYKPSRLSGLMRVDEASNLDEYHLSEDFASLPALGDSFIQSNTGSPLDRAVSVPSQPHFVADIHFKSRWARPMPMFGVPGNLDRF